MGAKMTECGLRHDHAVASKAITEHFGWNTTVSWLNLWQWIKHVYICMIQGQKNNLRS